MNSFVQSASAASPRAVRPEAEAESGPARNSAAQSPERANAATSGAVTEKNVYFESCKQCVHISGLLIQTLKEIYENTVSSGGTEVCTSLWGLSVALLVNLLHLLQQLTHVKCVWGSWGGLEELIHQLEQKEKVLLQFSKSTEMTGKKLKKLLEWNEKVLLRCYSYIHLNSQH